MNITLILENPENYEMLYGRSHRNAPTTNEPNKNIALRMNLMVHNPIKQTKRKGCITFDLDESILSSSENLSTKVIIGL